MTRSIHGTATALTVALAAALLMALTLAAAVTAPAGAHRSACHGNASCPALAGSLEWRGMVCVRRFSRWRDASFTKRLRHRGETYYCKRGAGTR